MGRLAYKAMLVMGIGAFCAPGAHAWQLDHARSSVVFSYQEDGAEKQGQFKQFDGSLDIDGMNITQSMASISVDTASLDMGDPFREGVLQGDPWLDSDTYPAARFRLAGLEAVPDRPGEFEAVGDLRIKGIVKPVRFPVMLTESNDDARASGSLRFSRSDFRLRDVVVESFVTIGPVITLSFDIIAEREAGDGVLALTAR